MEGEAGVVDAEEGGELAGRVSVGVDCGDGGLVLGVGALLVPFDAPEGGAEPAPPTSPEASEQNDIKRLT